MSKQQDYLTRHGHQILYGVVIMIGVVMLVPIILIYLNQLELKTETQNRFCYGVSCMNPYSQDEILGMSMEHEYVYLHLRNGSDIKTDCLTNDYPYGMSATEYWCSDGIKKGVFGT